jgi:hypothetical protein
MIKLLQIFLIIAIMIVGDVWAADWFTAGVLTDPVTDAILADTGAIAGALPNSYCVNAIVISSNVAAVVILEQRNAANAANITSQAILIQANDTITYPRFCVVLTGVNQRIRLRLNLGVTGVMQASIHP